MGGVTGGVIGGVIAGVVGLGAGVLDIGVEGADNGIILPTSPAPKDLTDLVAPVLVTLEDDEVGT